MKSRQTATADGDGRRRRQMVTTDGDGRATDIFFRKNRFFFDKKS
jgi:hypothetical protein